MFIEERFRGICGMLVGVGFAVQLTRAEARGEPQRSVTYWKLQLLRLALPQPAAELAAGAAGD